MGRRYGGRYSPPGDGAAKAAAPAAPLANRRARRTSLRARLLYLVPVPLFFAGLGATLRGSPIEAAVELVGFAGLMLAAWLTNEGIKAEGAFEARTVAKPPAVPRKLLGTALIGASVFGVGLLSLGQGLIGGLVFGAIGAAPTSSPSGPTRCKAKGLEGHDALTTERVARAIDEAEGVVRDIVAAAPASATAGSRAGSNASATRPARSSAPSSATRATSAAPGASSASTSSACATRRRSSPTSTAAPRHRGARGYEALLADLETSFAANRTALLEDRSGDLEIEIEVLRERLQQDGLVAR
jgi:hypothetical protein